RQRHRLQSALPDGERNVEDVGPLRGAVVRLDDLRQRHSLGQPRQSLHPVCTGDLSDDLTDAPGVYSLILGPGDLRYSDQQLVAVAGQAETWPVQRVASGFAPFHRTTHLRLVGVAQPQLDARVRHVQQALLLADEPAVGARHDVNAVRKSLPGNRDRAIPRRKVFFVEVAVVVDDEKYVAE